MKPHGIARIFVLAGILTVLLSLAHAVTINESLKFVLASKDFVELTGMAGLVIDLRYATPNNFVGQNMYGEFNKAFLHQIAAEKLTKALRNLQGINPKYKFVIFDALRPRSVQYVLWNKVKGTDREKYVANPTGGSIHNFGFALDLSILDETGRGLDMGTDFDDFSPLAQPLLENQFLKAGKLTDRQINTRRILRKVMEGAGFVQLPLEWWHFDALPSVEVKAKYKMVE